MDEPTATPAAPKVSAAALPTPSGGGTWLTRRDGRLRVLAVLALAISVVSLSQLPTLLLALALALVLAHAGGLGLRDAARRLAPLAGLMSLLLVTLTLTVPGAPWLQLGPFTATWDGLLKALAIALKAGAVALATLGLLGTIEPGTLSRALAQLRVPDKLIALSLFTVRYIHVLHAEHQRLRQALRARGFVARSDRHTWRTLGWLVGMLLVRSLERARRVTAAMKCRGFEGHFRRLDEATWQPADSAAAALLAGVLTALVALDRLG